MFSCSSQCALMSSVHLSIWLARRQLAEEEQIRDLEVVRALGELLDRVAAIFEDALVAVDEGDRAAARRGVHESRVVGDETEVLLRRS
jgi:hypothetical protein